MTYDNTNRGALFKNDRKEQENHPDYTGNLNVNGVEFWVSAWIKEGKSGAKFMSMSVKPKEPRGQSRPVTKDEPRRGSMKDKLDEDSIPF